MKKNLQKFDLWLSSLAIILMILIIFIQVLFRYSGHPLSWPEEVARWMMIWITFAGASYAFRNGGLIRVDYFVKKLFPKKTVRVINIIDMVVMALFFMFMGYSSLQYTWNVIRKNQLYQVTRVPYAFVSISLVLCSVLCIIFSIVQMIGYYKLRDDGPEKPGTHD